MNASNSTLPILMRWENPTNDRYYEARLQYDLLGDIVLIKVWGSKQSKLVGCSQGTCASFEVAMQLLRDLHQHRLSHGYQLIQNPISIKYFEEK